MLNLELDASPEPQRIHNEHVQSREIRPSKIGFLNFRSHDSIFCKSLPILKDYKKYNRVLYYCNTIYSVVVINVIQLHSVLTHLV